MTPEVDFASHFPRELGTQRHVISVTSPTTSKMAATSAGRSRPSITTVRGFVTLLHVPDGREICFDEDRAALKRMLNFNAPPLNNSLSEPVWKVLIYDRFGQDIISPLLSVKELRDMASLCTYLRNQLYETYFLNFISAISRSKLEDIASAALSANAVTQVNKVYDQYLNFITLEDDMFILCHQNKELISHKPSRLQDTDMDSIMDTIVDSLFCFFVTLGAVPIIRCPRGNAQRWWPWSVQTQDCYT
ncbi:hypothetical protein WMY93_026264 [Mugilogobius chulae]|uniref:Uncharacterized protein n=1 Tax=Mugilogobius chulae TaxID=88201 RepID=A0AAW0N1G2_9GOBI